MLVYIEKQPKMLGNPEIEAEGPYSVVLAPTRELAQQVGGSRAWSEQGAGGAEDLKSGPRLHAAWAAGKQLLAHAWL